MTTEKETDGTYRCIAPDGEGGFCDKEAIGRFKVDEGDRLVTADFCAEHEPTHEPEQYLNTDTDRSDNGGNAER